MNIPDDPYPDEAFPWNFYFNGVLMPKWGACWGLSQISRYLKLDMEWDNDLGHRDVYIIECRIDHVGVPESADPGVFLYVIQEVLFILLEHRNSVMESLRANPKMVEAEEVYDGLVSAAFQMRALVMEQRMAFWTSGYEADQEQLVKSMELARLPASDPRHVPPPHLSNFQSTLTWLLKSQKSQLHRLAQSGQFHKKWRRELREI